MSAPHLPPIQRRSLGVMLLLGLGLGLPSACAAGLPTPNAVALAHAQERDPATTLADLSRGRTLYVSKCGACHALRDPASLPPERWGQELDEMREEQGVHLAIADANDILRYLQAVSSTRDP